jgi:tRNA threonylcarbamoyl adenosine modification protein YeaZ
MVKETEQASVILAIESAVAGGSISLIRGGKVIAATAGRGSVSRAEDLLSGIDALLNEARVEKSELTRIAVSIGPGSFTGLRIGLSTAMGLSTALGIPCKGVPLFDAVAAGTNDDVAIVVPLGRADLCYRLFDNGVAKHDHLVGDTAAFTSFVQANRSDRIAHHPDVDLSHFDSDASGNIVLTDIGYNLAEYVGRHAANSGDTGSLEPIYVRNPRFA